MGKNFRGHGLLLFLSSELHHGFTKLMADKCLGRAFAGLLPFIEGLYQMGYISKDTYEAHVEKYSIPLYVEESKPEPKEQPKCAKCGKVPVVDVFIEKTTGIEKKVCRYHANNLREHPKWQVVSDGSV